MCIFCKLFPVCVVENLEKLSAIVVLITSQQQLDTTSPPRHTHTVHTYTYSSTTPVFSCLAPHELHLYSKPSLVTCDLSIIALLKAVCMSVGLTLFTSKYASCILAERLTTSSTLTSLICQSAFDTWHLYLGVIEIRSYTK